MIHQLSSAVEVRMKFFLVSRSSSSGHAGYGFYTSKREAEEVCADWRKQEETCQATVEQIEVVPTRTGIRLALNKYASHNDNG
jgi:hypothetical protein